MSKDLNRSIKIFIDNSDAMKKSKELETRMTGLRQRLQELHQQGQKGSPEYIRTEKALQQLSTSYGRYQDKLKETERILKNLSGATESQLLAVRKQLRSDLKNTIRDTEEYKTKLQALMSVEKELTLVQKEQSISMGRKGNLWSNMADGFNKYFGIVTSFIAGITGISYTLRKLAEDVAQMDDVYADVMKTTGMTRDEVVELNEVFKQMDTRTARDQINLLARDAGKLGLTSRKDILDFVEAGNQINVSLGEDLGEGAIKNIGKMTDVYALSTKELERLDLKGKMLAIGSAVNELGATSTANEAYLVNFAQRLGGVASQAGISIQNILGYASALDQSGQAVEMSATALQKFIMTLMGDPIKFAKIAGLEIKNFNQLLRTDTNEAIKQVLTSLSNKGGFQALIPIFKDMGLDGARAVGVLSALATNINKVNAAQEISNKAFAEGTSVSDEYNIKNNNLQAQLEKGRKAFKDAALELGEKLNPALLISTKSTTYIIKLLPNLISLLEKYGKYILYVAGAYASYIAGVKLQIYWQTVSNALLAISKMRLAEKALAQALETGNTTRAAVAERLYASSMVTSNITAKAYVVVTNLLSAAKYLLVGNIKAARLAMIQFNDVFKKNPYGIILTAVIALGYAIYELTKRFDKQSSAIKKLKEIEKDFNSELSKEITTVNELFRAYKNTNPESDEHKRIREIIMSKYGDYIKDLVNEKNEITDIGKAIAIVNEKLREQIALKIRDKAVEEIRVESLNVYTDIVDKIMDKVSTQIRTKDVGSEIRKSLNTMLTNIQETDNYTVDDMSGRIDTMLRQYGIDTYKGGGFFGSNIDDYVGNLLVKVKETNGVISTIKGKYDGMINEMTEVQSVLDNNGDNNDDNTPSGGTTKASEQKKTLDLIMENLETKHQEKLLNIKIKYRRGDISSESEYNKNIFAEEQAYSLLKEQTLEINLAKIKDKELKSDVTKQLAVLKNKRLDDEISFRSKLQKIILGANPEARELIEFENRLQDAGLFGKERESLTADQLSALELLEKQHQENLLKIADDAKVRRKAQLEKDFEEGTDGRGGFKNERNNREAELTQEDRSLSTQISTGMIYGTNAFDAEIELHNKRIQLIKDEIQARKIAGTEKEELNDRLYSAEQALTDKYISEYNRRTGEAQKYGNDIGTIVGSVITGQEDAMQAFSNIMIDILFDMLSQMINAEIARLTIVGTSTIAETTAKQIATKGIFGIGTAAMLTGIITAAITTAKSTLKGMLGKKKGSSSSSSSSDSGKSSGSVVVQQRKKGKYNVIGEEDNKLYSNVSYTGVAQTGVVNKPVLVGERGSELIVSAPDFIALRKHINYPLIVQAIQESRQGTIPQRKNGNYSKISNFNNNPFPSADMNSNILSSLTQAINAFNNKETHVNLGVTELQAKMNAMNKENNRFSRK